MSSVVALIVLATSTSAGPTHDDAIKLFAASMAIAKTVKDNWLDFEGNDSFL